MAIVCLYIEKNVRMRWVARCVLSCCGLTGPDGMSNRDSSSWPFSPSHILIVLSSFSGQTIGLRPMANCPSGRVWDLHLWWKRRPYDSGSGEEGAETTEDSKVEEERQRSGSGSKQTQGQNPLSLHLPLFSKRLVETRSLLQLNLLNLRKTRRTLR